MPSITQPAAPCHIPANTNEEILLGVDTHKDFHAAAIVTVLGATLDGRTFPATTEGYRQLVSWARSFGALRRAGVECTGSYGAALARILRAEGIEVTEVNQPDKAARRRRGKTDAVDAEAAARAVLSGRATATAKTSDGPIEALRLLKLAKASEIKSRTQAINQLKSVLISAEAALRESLAGLSNPHLFKRCAELDDSRGDGPADTARHVLKLLAGRIQHLTGEIDNLNGRRQRLNSGLLGVFGIRADRAAEATALLLDPQPAGLAVLTAREIIVEADREDIQAGIDGEAFTLPAPVRCRIERRALRVPRRRPGVPQARPAWTGGMCAGSQ
ncbi:IS110 family transposase [Streptomyces sp. NBC_00453]|uniref:IS110 family transposase n=1 Tax=Streptomyces sp. NBC_00453 TaxID=2903653 RepID=UPI003FA70C86